MAQANQTGLISRKPYERLVEEYEAAQAEADRLSAIFGERKPPRPSALRVSNRDIFDGLGQGSRIDDVFWHHHGDLEKRRRGDWFSGFRPVGTDGWEKVRPPAAVARRGDRHGL